MSNELITTPATNEEIGNIIRDMMSPVLSAMAELVQRNTDALERLATQQKIQSDRMEALEKQIRLNTPVSATQVKYLNASMKEHARELLDGFGLSDDSKSVSKVTATIRKHICSYYGVGTVREIPKHEYTVAMTKIANWNNIITIRDIVREARNRNAQENVDNA